MLSEKRKENLRKGYLPKTKEEKTFYKRVEAGRATAAKRPRIDGRFLSTKAIEQVKEYAEMAGVKKDKLNEFIRQNEDEIKRFYEGRPVYYSVKDSTFQYLSEYRNAKFTLNIEGVLKKVSKNEALRYIAEMNLQMKSTGENVTFELKTQQSLNTGEIVIPCWDIDTFNPDLVVNGKYNDMEDINIHNSPKKKK